MCIFSTVAPAPFSITWASNSLTSSSPSSSGLFIWNAASARHGGTYCACVPNARFRNFMSRSILS